MLELSANDCCVREQPLVPTDSRLFLLMLRRGERGTVEMNL
jgi:hypothetical protein